MKRTGGNENPTEIVMITPPTSIPGSSRHGNRPIIPPGLVRLEYTPDRYPQARIIFSTRNAPIGVGPRSKTYYWHRSSAITRPEF